MDKGKTNVTALNSLNKKAFGLESVQNSYDAKLLYFHTCLFFIFILVYF